MVPPAAKLFSKGDRVYVRAQQVWLALVMFVMSRDNSEKTMTYGALAEKLGLDKRAAIGLGRELGILGYFCKLNDLPAINSIVVNHQTGLPGAGVVVRDGKTFRQEQAETLKFNWLQIRVPTTGTLRQIWDEYMGEE
jgi:hypothetical protein